MAPPITQSTTTSSNSASGGSSSAPTNRLEREARKHDRRY